MIQVIKIDISSGGNGDIWMRLISFYAIAAIEPSLKIYLFVPRFMSNLAEYTFGDRIIFLNSNSKCDFYYTSLGLRDLYRGILRGRKYIAPYQRSVIRDKKIKKVKDYINTYLFNFADYLGFIQVPGWEWIEKYQGYLDIIGLQKIKKITYENYLNQINKDYQIISLKLNQREMPTSPELVVPKDLNENVLVFPTGTSRQFIPASWAKRHLPNAYYSFFAGDLEAKKFETENLKIIYFYKEPGDIISLALHSKWTITTDSFPSHLLQSATNECTVTITEVLKSRIVSPTFKGIIIDSRAKCHPCLHLDRKSHPTCMAGFSECINWNDPYYTQDILQSIPA